MDATTLAAIQLNDLDDDNEVVRRRAEKAERRADEQWRKLEEEQRRRSEEADQKAQADLRRKQAREQQQRALDEAQAQQQQLVQVPQMGDDLADAAGWTPREQRALQDALRACPAKDFKSAGARWQAVAARLPGRTAKECLQRCKQLAVAVKANRPPPLLRLETDVLLSVLEWLGGRALCAAACVCKDLRSAAHDQGLWMPFAESLPLKWAYSARERCDEPVWRYTLRMREGLYGSWRMLTEHRAGLLPYLRAMGHVVRGRFVPEGAIDHRVPYGAVCELVQLQAAEDGSLSHRTYKAVAATLVACSANKSAPVPMDMHMTVREIYKTCYPGFGAGTGSGAYAPGLQAGGSSTKAATSGPMLGKSVAAMTRKVDDENMRKRLDTRHVFLSFITH
eukprot:CAMPEP_0119061444 /NCGR_PEP_ID=MMETSP1178-20130426/5226_1 /TAXON_ID=33656 /ORGANISM="unid sp, Strain CCMP2000" /LENGTH=393 /DNA_ID=CAMNT_0007042649 /DNA_START=28 /DNA_END=1209 /DNA_ORIENTATION=-